MTNMDLANNIIQIALFIALISSFYILMENMTTRGKTNKYSFNTWQFPMLLALFFDAIFLTR